MASLASYKLGVSDAERYQAMIAWGTAPILVAATRAGLCYAPAGRQIRRVAVRGQGVAQASAAPRE